MRILKDSGIDWIGEVPDNWELLRIKHIMDSVTIKNKYENNYIGLENIEKETGKYLVASEKTTLGGDTLSYETGNILFGKLRPYLAKVYKTTEKGCCSSEFLVLDLKKGNIDFYKYRLLSPDFIEAVNSSTYGTKMPRASWEFIMNMVLPTPPIIEQQKIANYLDQKVALIDNIIEKTKVSIEEYKNYKQSIITETVTKGLNSDVKMKDSGIEWNKEIPQHWHVVNPKRLFDLRKEKAYEEDEQLTASQKHGILLQKEFMEIENQKVVTVEKDFSILKHVEPNDFVISMRSFQGGLEYSTVRGCISSAYVMIIPKQEVHPPYYRWLFKSEKYINALQSTSNLVRDGQAMRFANFVQIPLFQIPLEEQKLIANYLEDKTNSIDKLINMKENLLIELESYKKSLIYEVVTGKREI